MLSSSLRRISKCAYEQLPSASCVRRFPSFSNCSDYVAAISVGVYEGVPVLDLDYDEDSRCDTDMNVVMTGEGGFVEVQGTAEGVPFSRDEMNALLDLAQQGIRTLIEKQQAALGIGEDKHKTPLGVNDE